MEAPLKKSNKRYAFCKSAGQVKLKPTNAYPDNEPSIQVCTRIGEEFVILEESASTFGGFWIRFIKDSSVYCVPYMRVKTGLKNKWFEQKIPNYQYIWNKICSK